MCYHLFREQLILTFASVDEILCRYHLNETSSAVPSHGTVCLRWLNWIFLAGYLPSLSLNYVGMSKDVEKRLPQLYYIKMKIVYDLGFIAIGVAMAT